MDESQIPHEPARPVLEYPIARPADFGIPVVVAPGVTWIRMPLPFSLDHINVYGIEEAGGWAIIDTGTRTEQTLAAWRKLQSEKLDAKKEAVQK